MSGSATQSGESVDALVSEVEAAEADLAAVEDRIAEYGVDQVDAVADAVARARELLERYEGSATGSGDFEAYVNFQGEFQSLTDSLPEDLPARDAFEAANDHLDQRRLSVSDFERARDILAPAREVADLQEERREAEDRLTRARRDAKTWRDELTERIEDLERLQRLGNADLDAPVEEIRDPIEAYDEAVVEAFQQFRREAPARELLEFVVVTESYPLVEFDAPPSDLLAYVRDRPAGEEPLPTLLEYADYSGSKLDHYLDDVGAFRTTVPVHRTYLDRLDATPLTVGWPAPTADELRYLVEELVAVVARFADEETVARAREVRALADRADYDRLREAGVARAEVTDEERRRIENGNVADELAAARDKRDRLDEALAGA